MIEKRIVIFSFVATAEVQLGYIYWTSTKKDRNQYCHLPFQFFHTLTVSTGHTFGIRIINFDVILIR